MKHVNLDFERYAEKCLTSEEQAEMKGADVAIYIDADSHCIMSRINQDQRVPLATIENQDRIVHKLVQRLYEDRIVQTLL